MSANDLSSQASNDVASRLESCTFKDISQKRYKVVEVIATIEGLNRKAAANRWASMKKKLNLVTIPGPQRYVCVDEEGLNTLLMSTTECESKTLALSTRGHSIDKTKTREIVIHAGVREVSVQVDYATQKLPVKSVISAFGFSEKAADMQIIRIKEASAQLAIAIGAPMRVNGSGQPKLCADLATIIQMIWMMPRNKQVDDYRMKCARDIVRMMKGDITLVDEIERNNAIYEATGVLHVRESSGDTPPCVHSAIEAAQGIAVRLEERKRRLYSDEPHEVLQD
jgi:hypothetical protein